MEWVCYRCGGPARKTETEYPEKVTTVSPCGCVGEPGESMAGPLKFRPEDAEE
jgi:hypothetical protein